MWSPPRLRSTFRSTKASPGWTVWSSWRSRAVSVAAQPATPIAGGVWILPTGATGAVWAGQPAGVMMRFEAGAWEALAPAEGVLAWVKDENQVVAYDGVAWAPLSASFKALTAAASPGLANTRLEILEQEVTVLGRLDLDRLSSSRPGHRAGGLDPHHGRGHRGDLVQLRRLRARRKFGGSLGVAKNASNVGVIGPTAYYADTPVLLTAVGGELHGGKVRVAIHLLRFDAPAAVA
jgi:hypothetical protein